MPIESVRWGALGDRTYHDERGCLFALWPEPVDHDACFESAGFDRFADTDRAWDAEFAIIIQDLLATLAVHGSPVVTGEPLVQHPLIGRLFRKRAPRLPLPEQIALVAHDDQFAPCHVDFGSPVRAAIHVSDGHPILWVWLRRDVANGWPGSLSALARGHTTIETTLRWEVLVPESLLT